MSYVGALAHQAIKIFLFTVRKVRKDEMALVVEVVFPTLIYDANKIILGCLGMELCLPVQIVEVHCCMAAKASISYVVT